MFVEYICGVSKASRIEKHVKPVKTYNQKSGTQFRFLFFYYINIEVITQKKERSWNRAHIIGIPGSRKKMNDLLKSSLDRKAKNMRMF